MFWKYKKQFWKNKEILKKVKKQRLEKKEIQKQLVEKEELKNILKNMKDDG